MKAKPSFTCQQDRCGRRRTYHREGMWLVVDACACGDAAYSLAARD